MEEPHANVSSVLPFCRSSQRVGGGGGYSGYPSAYPAAPVGGHMGGGGGIGGLLGGGGGRAGLLGGLGGALGAATMGAALLNPVSDSLIICTSVFASSQSSFFFLSFFIFKPSINSF